MSRNPIAGVVFDVGRVLADVSYEIISAGFGRHSNLTPEEIYDQLVGGDLEIESETGKYESRELFRRLKERINGSSDWSYDQFVEEFTAGLSMRDDGIAALQYAASRTRVFLMSNTNYPHAQWMYSQEVLATLPEQHFFSFREGIMKPDPRLWEIFFARTGLTGEQCLFIDDLRENCDGAAKLGLTVVNFDANEHNLVAILKDHLHD